MKMIIFIVPSLDNSHYKNRILEFIEKGYKVKVYGFCRNNKELSLLYDYTILGNIENASYANRIKLYYIVFKQLGKEYKDKNVVFYLCGLDIAIFFHYLNPQYHYIYEECDLVHTYTKCLKYPLEWLDKKIIKKSLITVTTSEGFINYHFGAIRSENLYLIENKLNPDIVQLDIKHKSFDIDNLSIGFVGYPRFETIYNFIDVFCRNFPNYTFHVFGGPVSSKFKTLEKYENCKFHGFYKNPIDLPKIYNSIDLVLSTYDTWFDNVRYAEPNKIYESIYFETPIIVSSNTFIAGKVKRLGIGFDINAMNEDEIIRFIEELDEDILKSKHEALEVIDKRYALNVNDGFFEFLKTKIEKISH